MTGPHPLIDAILRSHGAPGPIAKLEADCDAIRAQIMADFERDSRAALARVLGTPERAETVAELAAQRDALRESNQ